MLIKINITKEILRASISCGFDDSQVGESCAFALAFREIFPKAYVGRLLIHPFGMNHDENHIEVPDDMGNFISVFDGLKHNPIERMNLPEESFQLDIPDWVIDRIGLQQVNEILSKSETLTRVI